MNIESQIINVLGENGWTLQRIIDELQLQGSPLMRTQVEAALVRLRTKRIAVVDDGVWRLRHRPEAKAARAANEDDKSESRIQREVMIEASKNGYTLWRNNVGRAWQGKRIDVSGAKIVLKNGHRITVGNGILLTNYRPVDFGLCKGSSDLIGLRGLEITAEHVGQKIAQFAAIEVKTKKGSATPEQKNFLRFVEDAGGVALVVRDKTDIQ